MMTAIDDWGRSAQTASPSTRALWRGRWARLALGSWVPLLVAGCASQASLYRDHEMDFGSLERVAVLPFENLSKQDVAAERVYDVFTSHLLATGAFYVIPRGEVDRGLARAGIGRAGAPAPEDIVKLRGVVNADAVITGVVREYDELRSDRASGNVISLSVKMYETQTGKVVWSASTTEGGVGLAQRLLGGGGRPMNDVTEEAVNELLDLLFR